MMKRLCVVATALMMTFILTQCAKDNNILNQASEGQRYVTLTAGKGDLTRTTLSESELGIVVNWSDNDCIYVYGSNDGFLGKLKIVSGQNSPKGNFGGYINNISSYQDLHFYFAGSGSLEGDSYRLNIDTQAGNLPDIAANMQLMAGTLFNVSPATLEFGRVTMENIISIIKVDTKTVFGSAQNIVVSGSNSSASINLKTAEVIPLEGNITLTDTASEACYVALLSDGSAQTLSFTKDAAVYFLPAKTILPGKNYSSTSGHITLNGYIENEVDWGPGINIEGTVWAPVNCGIWDGEYPKGKLYQWGRRYGQPYSPDPSTNGTQMSLSNGNSETYQNTHFTINPWYSGATRSDVWGQQYNPCPPGWRVPTSEEFEDLLSLPWDWNNETHELTFYSDESRTGNSISFYATGSRSGSSGHAENEGSILTYYSSATSRTRGEACAEHLSYSSGSSAPTLQHDGKFDARAVRCVYDPSYTISLDNSSLTFINGGRASERQAIDVTCNKLSASTLTPVYWKIKSYKIGASGSEVPVEGSSFTAGGITVAADLTNSRLVVVASARENSGNGSHGYWTGSHGDWSPSNWSGVTDLSTLNFQDEHQTDFAMTTANCYIIRHAGTYKLPLVYGNGVKGGLTNTNAYSAASGTGILSSFIAHDGSTITSPFIEDKCKVAKASVVWQDGGNVVKDLSITGTYQSSGNTISTVRYLQFTVDPATVCQNNAVIAVKDESGNIIWSWHIWITNNPAVLQSPIPVTSGGTNFNFLNLCALGLLSDAIYLERETVTITICPNDDESITSTVKILQPEVIEHFGTVYQFGRKDPLSILSDLYGERVTVVNGKTTIANAIKNPSTMYATGDYVSDWSTEGKKNLWGNTVPSSRSDKKTIYDPSPIGYMVPVQSAFSGFTSAGTWVDGGKRFPANSGTIFFPALSYRSSNKGDYKPASYSVQGSYWSNTTPTDTPTHAYYLRIESNPTEIPWVGRSYGFFVRPVKE